MNPSRITRAPEGGRPILVAVLAAGRGRRMLGRDKSRLRIRGRSLQQRLESIVAAIGLPMIVIVGCHRGAASPMHYPNRAWRSGMGSSVALAARIALGQRVRPATLLLLPGDLLMTDDELLPKLIRTWRRAPAGVAATAHHGLPGAPALFPPRYWPGLARLRGPEGARRLLRQSSMPVRLVDADDRLHDIDTLQDLRHIRGQLAPDHRQPGAKRLY